MNEVVSWKIVFYRYTDSKSWNRTHLIPSEEEFKKVKDNLEKEEYVDKKSIISYNILLPK